MLESLKHLNSLDKVYLNLFSENQIPINLSMLL